MFLLLAMLACSGDSVEPTTLTRVPDAAPEALGAIQTRPAPVTPVAPPPPRQDPLPPGEPLITDCYGAGSDGYGPRPRPTPRPSPMPSMGGSGGIVGGAPTTGAQPPPMARSPRKDDAPTGAAPPMNKPQPEPPPQPAPPPQAAPVDSAPMDSRSGNRRDNDAPVASEPSLADGRYGEREEKRAAEAYDEAPPQGPQLEWGATVHLSNDDSMSLASAQRVLWRLDKGQVPPVKEVRPHELLNYFSFDTAPVADGQTFSVLGGAVQDGDTLTVSLAVRGAMPERQPLDLSLLVDRSCSMGAEGRMDYTKRGLTLMTEQLQRGDRIDLILFDTRVCAPVKNFVVGRDDPAILRDAIARMRPTGGTNLHAGLQEAYTTQTAREPAEVHGRNRRVVLITDALLNEGKVDEHLVSEVGRHLDDHGIRLTGVGVGREFNDSLLDRLTEKGKGAYVYLGSEAVVDRVFGAGFRSLVQTIAHDVRFSLELPQSLAMERFYGEESSTNEADIQPIHYYANTTQLFLQDLRIRDGRAAASDPLTFTIRWRDAITGEPETMKLRTTIGALLDGDPRNVHKGRALMGWSDVILARAMRSDGCGEPMRAYLDTAALLSDDAEIAYTTGLLGKICRLEERPIVTAAPRGVTYKVKVDSDVSVAGVRLDCGPRGFRQALSGGGNVARFDEAVPGRCMLTLQGPVPLRTSVDVPSTGGDVRCMVRGGRLSCS